MPIVSSDHVVGPPQADGRVYVTETHTDQYGLTYTAEYIADPLTADYIAVRDARATAMSAQLIDREVRAMLVLGAPLAFRYAAASDLAAGFRAAYKFAKKVESGRLAKWILDHIDAADFTDAQVRNVFGLSAGQYTTLKAKFTTYRDAYNALVAAAGE